MPKTGISGGSKPLQPLFLLLRALSFECMEQCGGVGIPDVIRGGGKAYAVIQKGTGGF